jgi:hypothetical protein
VVGFRRIAQLNGQLGAVTAVCYLLYPPRPEEGPELSVRHFLEHTMPCLLPQLSRTTQPWRAHLHGRADGRIDWSNTYKARYSEGCNPTLFVCQQSRWRYDQPENQLVKSLLKQIQTCLDQTPDKLRGWFARGSARCAEGHEPVRIGTELAAFAHWIRRYQASAYLREIRLPAVIGESHLAAARTAKNPLYAQVADLYQLYLEVVEVTDWGRWVTALNRTAPRPPHMDDVTRLLVSTTRYSPRY